MELSKMYFDQLGRVEDDEETAHVEVIDNKKTLFQCQDCLTIYDEVFGDENLNIDETLYLHTHAYLLC